jgi:hypothetical protein
VNQNAVNFNILRNCKQKIEKQNLREKAHEPALFSYSVDERYPLLLLTILHCSCSIELSIDIESRCTPAALKLSAGIFMAVSISSLYHMADGRSVIIIIIIQLSIPGEGFSIPIYRTNSYIKIKIQN